MNNKNIYKKKLNSYEYQLYARQLILPQIQTEGQERLKQSKILFIGTGGLASAALLYLVACGIGEIGLVDDDKIELSNLQRQIIYNTFTVGQLKVISAKNQLQQINPICKVQIYNLKLISSNSFKIIQPYDIIIDGTDNFETRYIISDTCKILHKVHIYGAIFEFDGQVSIFNYKGGPSYKEISPLLKVNITRKCSVGGVLGVVPGLIGVIQATEAIKIITGINVSLSGHLLIYNGIELSFKHLLIRNLNNYLGFNNIQNSTNRKNSSLEQQFISFNQLKNILNINIKAIYLIDVRNEIEYKIKHIYTAINIPLRKLKKIHNIKILEQAIKNKKLIIYCNNQVRSQAASIILMKANIEHLLVSNIIF
uniref:Probable molybdopterin-synthase adenylyltransferase n=1 Tax=Lympha mucosa TaxID=2045360 RepID=A0A6B9VP55_9FLOR|nr:Molybdopterin biosynthesis protein [Lympha mucosa]